MNLPTAVAASFDDLSSALPLEQAMASLDGSDSPDPAILRVAEHVARDLSPALQAGIYLYVGALDRAHSIAQFLNSEEGAFWHGVMHRREGDYSNARYWFRRAGNLPKRLELDPIALTDAIEKLTKRDDPNELAARQRAEWVALFEHCAQGETA